MSQLIDVEMLYIIIENSKQKMILLFLYLFQINYKLTKNNEKPQELMVINLIVNATCIFSYFNMAIRRNNSFIKFNHTKYDHTNSNDTSFVPKSYKLLFVKYCFIEFINYLFISVLPYSNAAFKSTFRN